jgi:hypothetical protein
MIPCLSSKHTSGVKTTNRIHGAVSINADAADATRTFHGVEMMKRLRCVATSGVS